MSAAVMPSQIDIGESFYQVRRNSSGSGCRMQQQTGYERRQIFATNTVVAASSYSQSRHRNLSGPSTTGATTRPALDNRSLATPPPGVPAVREGGCRDVGPSSGVGGSREASHRKLDRSLSDSEDRINGNHNGRGVNSARYKTELCRPYEESGHCKYGDKCQFAHGAHELRNLTRHPKYKTERCRTYHTIGFCPYGPRCHFIHNEDERIVYKSSSRVPQQQQQRQQQQQILPPSSSSHTSSYMAQRPNNLCGLNSISSSFESVSTSSSSPGNLSPSLAEDTFPSITTFSPSSANETLPPSSSSHDSTSECSSPVFNFPASDAVGGGSILTPLQIQTQTFQNILNLTEAIRFSTMASQNQLNNTFANLNISPEQSTAKQASVYELDQAENDVTWLSCETKTDIGGVLPPPSTSPVSSDDSMGSTGSLESVPVSLDNASYLVNSPLEVGRSMRLPIFNQLSEL